MEANISFLCFFVHPFCLSVKKKDIKWHCTLLDNVARLHLMAPMHFWWISIPLFCVEAFCTRKKAIFENNLKNKVEPTAIRHFIPHYTLRHFFLFVILSLPQLLIPPTISYWYFSTPLFSLFHCTCLVTISVCIY